MYPKLSVTAFNAFADTMMEPSSSNSDEALDYTERLEMLEKRVLALEEIISKLLPYPCHYDSLHQRCEWCFGG